MSQISPKAAKLNDSSSIHAALNATNNFTPALSLNLNNITPGMFSLTNQAVQIAQTQAQAQAHAHAQGQAQGQAATQKINMFSGGNLNQLSQLENVMQQYFSALNSPKDDKHTAFLKHCKCYCSRYWTTAFNTVHILLVK